MAHELLLDVDPGRDDAVALTLALLADEVDLVGVTTVAGNTTLENATRNALSILELLDRPEVPVAAGCARPLVDELQLAEAVHGPGGLPTDLPAPGIDPTDEHAADAIVRAARERGDDLTIAAVGPLTNLALALAKEPDLPALVDEIYLMGGAVRTEGNTTPAAEFNFHVDPAAASRVVQDANPKVVGLDVTNRATIPGETIQEYAAAGEPLATVARWMGDPSTGAEKRLHDAVVVVDLLDGVLGFEAYPVEIDTTGGPCHGAVVADVHGVTDAEPNAAAALEVDVDRFRERVRSELDTLA